ncbi:MAG: DoxX family protein [Methylacidiphilales bacterium]|nr:DoxX family protein [Candidatus Methylacidiphilales bacterium]
MKTSAWSPHLLSILRIMSALLFLEHGTSKLLGVPASGMHWSFQATSLVGWSGIIEFIGGILLALGLFTRFTAFILSGEMAVAYFTVHAPGGFFPLANKGEIAVLYCFVFLYLAVAGGGPWSLDRLRHRG